MRCARANRRNGSDRRPGKVTHRLGAGASSAIVPNTLSGRRYRLEPCRNQLHRGVQIIRCMPLSRVDVADLSPPAELLSVVYLLPPKSKDEDFIRNCTVRAHKDDLQSCARLAQAAFGRVKVEL